MPHTSSLKLRLSTFAVAAGIVATCLATPFSLAAQTQGRPATPVMVPKHIYSETANPRTDIAAGLAKAHERGRINDEDYAAAQTEKLVFDRSSSPLTEKQCLDWVKKITARPEPEIPADAEALDGDADGAGDRGPLPGKARHRGGKEKGKGAAAKAEGASEAAKVSPRP